MKYLLGATIMYAIECQTEVWHMSQVKKSIFWEHKTGSENELVTQPPPQ